MNQFDPLKYRGVFDYPTVQTRNLLPPNNETESEQVLISSIAAINAWCDKCHAICTRSGGRCDICNSPANTHWTSSPIAKHDDPVEPPFTSQHVLRFFGWAGNRAKYVGEPQQGSVLDQRDAWIKIWLEKGRHEAERKQQREAAKASGVSTKKSAQRRARAA